MLLNEFISTINHKKISKPYYYLLKNFEEYLISQGRTLDNFTPSDVQIFMHKQPPSSSNVFLAAIRQFAEWKAQRAYSAEDYILESRRVLALRQMRPLRNPKKIVKTALNTYELDKLLNNVKVNIPLYIATMVFFYFGWRPSEATNNILDADINFDGRYMIIKTAKAGHDRIVPWSPRMDDYVKGWYLYVKNTLSNYKYPEEWYTKNIKPLSKNIGFKITARSARKTFETQMRKLDIEQWKIDAILGHTNNKIRDVYTDWTQLLEELRDIMENKHYMIVHKIIR